MWTLARPSARAAPEEGLRARRSRSRRWWMVCLFLLLCPPALLAQAAAKQSNPLPPVSPPSPLTVGGKFRFHLKAAYGPGSLLAKAATASSLRRSGPRPLAAQVPGKSAVGSAAVPMT